MAGYFIIVIAAIAGLAGLGWWAPALAGAALHLTVAGKYWELWRRARQPHQQSVAASVWGVSVLQAAVACGGAYILGLAVRWSAF